MKKNLLSDLYNEKNPIQALGSTYRHPKGGFPESGALVKVASIPAGEDGRSVEIYECRHPAAFYTIRVLPDQKGAGYTLTTGSGQGELAGQIAKAIADGMLGLELQGQR